MSTRPHTFAPDSFYHLYNRGTDKRIIFLEISDYERFIELLYLCNSELSVNMRDIHSSYDTVFDFDRGITLTSIGAYCLMPNHFHLLVKANANEGVTRFMGKVSTGYSMYFNKKYERSGALFQGSFKSELASDDRYLKYLFSYIHLNPIKLLQPDWKERGIANIQNAFDYARNYEYSSLKDHLEWSRPQSKILHISDFPSYFSTGEAQAQELVSWLDYPNIP
jgi:putative transposase